MQIHLSEYQPSWPSSFATIAADLSHTFTPLPLHPHLKILHIGSTAVPTLLAKPIIDILILIPLPLFQKHIILQQFRGALFQAGYHYIGTGGVAERWSFKLNPQDPRLQPKRTERNVYVAPEGGMVNRSCVALRDTLRVHADLREEYAKVKMQAAGIGIGKEGEGEGLVEYDNVMQYSDKKNGVVRRVLKRAGWSDEEVDVKERMAVRDWPREDEGGFFQI